MAIFSFGGGVSKAQAAKQAKDEAKRAVKKSTAPQPGDLLKKVNEVGHTAVDPKSTVRPSELSSTKLDEDK